MLSKTERDEMRAFCADARARCITWNEADKINDIAVKALDELDAKDREIAERDATIAAQMKVLRLASDHLCDLLAAWQRGAITEHDGGGGTRSNRNFDVAQAIHRVQQSDAGAKLLADHAAELDRRDHCEQAMIESHSEWVKRAEAAEANLAAEKESHLATLNNILRRVQRPGSPPPGGHELAILIYIRQWQEENAALHKRLEAAIAEARRTRDEEVAKLREEIRALMQRLEAAEAETKRVVDLVKANDIAALIVDRAQAIKRAQAAENEIRALLLERKGEVWFW